jgi:hypothetical protein
MFILLGCLPMCAPIGAQIGPPASAPIQAGAQAAEPANGSQQQPKAASPRRTTDILQSNAAADTPLPDIAAMMHDVETNQRKAEAIEKDYLYHSIVTEQKVDGHGQVKKTEVTEFDHFWVNGVPEVRMVKKDGKPLSADEIAKEDERIDKEAAKAHERREKGDAEGKETDPRGDEEITVSRLLELGSFTNPRRVRLNARDTIAVDYAGNPQAKTHNRAEEVVRDMVGTAWIDEEDHVLAQVDGHFVNAFKVGGGLIVNIQKDTHFTMEQIKVNNEVWLPAHIDAEGAARFLLFFNFDGSMHAAESDYRKFRTSSTILPGVTQVGGPTARDTVVQP